jgi:hypothetical protein
MPGWILQMPDLKSKTINNSISKNTKMKTIIVIALLALVLIGCAKTEDKGLETATGNNVRQEIESVMCDSAEKGDSCTTKLARIGLITQEQCCAQYQKCCQ